MSFSTPPQSSIQFATEPASIIEAAEASVAALRNTWDEVVSGIQPSGATWENTIIPIIQAENDGLMLNNVLKFYRSTHPSQDMRDASGKAATLLNNGAVELYGRTDLFLRINNVWQTITDGTTAVCPESLCYIKKLHEKFRSNGCALTDAAVKQQLCMAQKRILELTQQCNRNMDEDKAGVWLFLDELDGVPQSLIERLKRGTDNDHQGMFWVTTKTPQTVPVMKHATSQETRRKMYYAIQNRMVANTDLLKELVLSRDEAARILGYPNHATLKTAQKMVQSPDFVARFLSEIKSSIIPHYRVEADHLRALRASDRPAHAGSSEQLFIWDEDYYERISNESQRASDDALANYFELLQTLSKLLDIFEHIFGVHFEPMKTACDENSNMASDGSLVWHEKVMMYSAWDVDGAAPQFMGYAYLDLFPRQGKYSHGGHYSLQKGFLKTDGSRHYASSALVMNYNEPTAGGVPTLLSLPGVRKLFHEIGHMIHNLCTETKYASSGVVDRDFVEAPSLMFESFFSNPQVIIDASCHYSYISPAFEALWRQSVLSDDAQSRSLPPRQLSLEEAEALSRASRGSDMSRQLHNLFLSTYDMAIHSPTTHQELEEMNMTELYNKMRFEFTGLLGGEAIGDGWEWAHGQTVFRAILNAYDAGYYSYTLGRVMALDIFAVGFKDDPMSKEAGRKYRDMALKPGGSVPELETLTKYLGRELSMQPYLEWLGIQSAQGDNITLLSS